MSDLFSPLELRAQMVRKGYTQERLAKEMGITPKTLYLKMKNGKFGTDEVSRIMDVLCIKDPVPIFFTNQ